MSNEEGSGRRSATARWALACVPLVLLAALVFVIQKWGPGQALSASFPPVEDIAFKRVILYGKDMNVDPDDPKGVLLHVVNDGASESTIAQVLVDEAYWPFEIEPDATLGHLDTATIRLSYPWVEGDAHEITILTSTGVTFSTEIEVAVESPTFGWTYLATFTILGVYVGVIPVFLGLLWFPAMREIGPRGLGFLLSLTVGLLAFLGVDALHEAFEVAGEVPSSYQGVALVVLGFVGCVLLLQVLSRWARALGETRGEGFQRMVLSYTIAFGIGLHNLGEGLAIGSAYSLGNIALGSLLVIGFAIHNTTEGLAIVAPLARHRVPFVNFVYMGLLAGVPTILGAWIGGFTYSAVWSILFLGIGAGAIAQVIYAILGQLDRRTNVAGVLAPWNFAGLAVGFLVMYGTGLLVAF
jgi:zinc transporter ZupT